MRRFVRDRLGSVQIEYAMIGTLIALSLIAGARTIGNHIGSILTSASTSIGN